MSVGGGSMLVVHSRKDKEHGLWVWAGRSLGNMVLFLESHAGSGVHCAG